MQLRYRALFIAFGLMNAAAGCVYVREGWFSYMNLKRQVVFAPALMALGLFLAGLGLLPSGEWINRLILSKKPPQRRLPERHSRTRHRKTTA
jgi:hypothetical protein